jgi:GNAT superfamily N-acetyltransferase
VTGAIRPARAGDGAGIAACLADHRRFEQLPDDPPAAARHVEALIPDVEDPTRTMLVAEDGVGGIAGYVHWAVTHPVFLDGPSLYVTELFVRAAQRGTGVGSALLAAVHADAAALRASRVELLLVTDTEAHRRGFYAAHGYTEAARAAVLRRET